MIFRNISIRVSKHTFTTDLEHLDHMATKKGLNAIKKLNNCHACFHVSGVGKRVCAVNPNILLPVDRVDRKTYENMKLGSEYYSCMH